MPVFNRIEVDVIDVPCVVLIVAQRMLPVAPLPDPAFGLGDAACRAELASG